MGMIYGLNVNLIIHAIYNNLRLLSVIAIRSLNVALYKSISTTTELIILILKLRFTHAALEILPLGLP